MDPETIFALSTVPGKSGVAVVRISGQEVVHVLEGFVGFVPEERRAVFSAIMSPRDGAVIDHGVIVFFRGPASFTGEDSCEFQVHGSRAVIARLLSDLSGFDRCRLADSGEFSRRAFDNGKLDLTSLEGIADLVDAETEAQRRQAVLQSEGRLGAVFADWRTRLVRELAYFEAEIDFPDEDDVPVDLITAAVVRIRALIGDMSGFLRNAKQGERLRNGVSVVVAGSPNVGKSSLVNHLAQRDVAIVSATAGTTRDVIEVHLDLGGVPVVLSDTAGLRAASDVVEEEGVRRASARIESADIVLWLSDCRNTELGHSAGKLDSAALRVHTKADLVTEDVRRAVVDGSHDCEFLVSVKTGEGFDGLLDVMQTKASDLVGATEDPGITRERQRKCLQSCVDALARVCDDNDLLPELRAEELRRAVFELGRLTGVVGVEDVLDVIFRDFCIGK